MTFIQLKNVKRELGDFLRITRVPGRNEQHHVATVQLIYDKFRIHLTQSLQLVGDQRGAAAQDKLWAMRYALAINEPLPVARPPERVPVRP